MVNFLRRKSTVKDVDKKIERINVEMPVSRNDLGDRVYLKILREIKEKVDLLGSKVSTLEALNENIAYWSTNFDSNEYQDFSHYSEQFNSEIKKLHNKISDLEKKFEERIPHKVLSESKFKEEIQDGDDVVQRIVSEIKEFFYRKPLIPVEETLTLVESKRIEKIRALLKRHEKLSSSELSQLIGLSRTRCNEYFKKMESLGMAKSVLEKREKFYKLRI